MPLQKISDIFLITKLKMLGEEFEQNGATFIFEFNKSSIDAVPFICEDLGTVPNNLKCCPVEE